MNQRQAILASGLSEGAQAVLLAHVGRDVCRVNRPVYEGQEVRYGTRTDEVCRSSRAVFLELVRKRALSSFWSRHLNFFCIDYPIQWDVVYAMARRERDLRCNAVSG